MRRISNRLYPKIRCKNPACKIDFEPTNRRQVYCEPQCRINANNDKRFEADNTRFKDERQTRLNNKILERIWNKLCDKKSKTIERIILEYEQFRFDSQSLRMMNSKSHQPILWFHDYGLEMIDQQGKLFEIHKRS